MLRRHQNEVMILLALLFLIGAVLFRTYHYKALESQGTEAVQLISQMEDIATMKKLWVKNKKVPEKLASIKSTLGNIKIKTFKIEKKKAHILLENLNGSQLNMIVGKRLASIPIQIVEMSIDRNGENYRLELRCKW